jgi:hypothetical protein
MRNPGRPILAVCALLLAGGFLAGCTSGKPQSLPTETPKSTPTPSPVFTSDAQALAAATEVYRRFLAASDVIGHEGGSDPDRVRPYVNDVVLAAEEKQAQKLKDAHARSYGDTKVSKSQLQSVTQQGKSVTVSIYACEDLSDVDVRDDSGNSLIDPSRADFVAYEVRLEGESANGLVVAANKYWSGGRVCDS